MIIMPHKHEFCPERKFFCMDNDSLIVKPKRAKGEDGYKVFSIRTKEETVSRIDEIAA